jgi:hypothetical protein
MALVVGANGMAALRRRDFRASEDRRDGLLRCLACYAVKDHLPKGLASSLTRCPRTFVSIEPPAGSLPVVRVEHHEVAVQD